jgi:hypothetical protein
MAKNKDKKKKSMGQKARERADRQKNRGGSNLFDLPENTEIIKAAAKTVKWDFIPYIVSVDGHPEAQKGEEWYERTILVHYNVGVDKRPYICPRTVSKPCPLCEERKELMKNKLDDEESEALIEELRPKERQIFNVIDTEDPDTGVQLFEHSYFLFGDKLDEEIREGDEEIQDFAELKGGKTLVIRFRKQVKGTFSFLEASKITFKNRDDYDESILEDVLDLDKILKIPSYALLQKELHGVDVDTDDDGDDEEKDKGKGKGKGKDKDKKTGSDRKKRDKDNDKGKGKGKDKDKDESPDLDDLKQSLKDVKKAKKLKDLKRIAEDNGADADDLSEDLDDAKEELTDWLEEKIADLEDSGGDDSGDDDPPEVDFKQAKKDLKKAKKLSEIKEIAEEIGFDPDDLPKKPSEAKEELIEWIDEQMEDKGKDDNKGKDKGNGKGKGKDKDKGKNKKKLKCPADGVFGQDLDDYDECPDCELYPECSKAFEEQFDKD